MQEIVVVVVVIIIIIIINVKLIQMHFYGLVLVVV